MSPLEAQIEEGTIFLLYKNVYKDRPGKIRAYPVRVRALPTACSMAEGQGTARVLHVVGNR